jgi:hypothetical protein
MAVKGLTYDKKSFMGYFNVKVRNWFGGEYM